VQLYEVIRGICLYYRHLSDIIITIIIICIICIKSFQANNKTFNPSAQIQKCYVVSNPLLGMHARRSNSNVRDRQNGDYYPHASATP
jgi:hypothetical protein